MPATTKSPLPLVSVPYSTMLDYIRAKAFDNGAAGHMLGSGDPPPVILSLSTCTRTRHPQDSTPVPPGAGVFLFSGTPAGKGG